ncbi:AraC family transcriptional regulator [Streptosporangium longisporum]|uniref:AraC family transcriptional regulator n=1 Tax=Streptosporangium longisporum TaxID=46187 RepID=A0ABP6L9Q1_9ACTN
MEDEIERAVRRVIETMCDSPGEQLTIDDLARVAMFSKFHFSRIFRRLTGVPPGRFLSAVRLQEAKSLLLSTPLCVADVCTQVGYSAVGTFSTRFKYSVGVAPTQYRRDRGAGMRAPVHEGAATAADAVVRGDLLAPPDGGSDLVCVGLFPDPVPEGWPVRSTIVRSSGSYTLDRVPPGSWYLVAHSLVRHDTAPGSRGESESALLCVRGPITVRSGTTRTVDLPLRPRRVFDPPVLPAVFDARPDEAVDPVVPAGEVMDWSRAGTRDLVAS